MGGELFEITSNSEAAVPNDLIYEGITTQMQRDRNDQSNYVPNDLIYEGITTPIFGIHYRLAWGLAVPNDLIYEGITTETQRDFGKACC